MTNIVIREPTDLKRYKRGWLKTVDRRTSLYADARRRFEELYDEYGGYDDLTSHQRLLCERIVFVEFQLQTVEMAVVEGVKEIDVIHYKNLTGILTDLMKTLALDRRTSGHSRSVIDRAVSAWANALERDEDTVSEAKNRLLGIVDKRR